VSRDLWTLEPDQHAQGCLGQLSLRSQQDKRGQHVAFGFVPHLSAPLACLVAGPRPSRPGVALGSGSLAWVRTSHLARSVLGAPAHFVLGVCSACALGALSHFLPVGFRFIMSRQGPLVASDLAKTIGLPVPVAVVEHPSDSEATSAIIRRCATLASGSFPRVVLAGLRRGCCGGTSPSDRVQC
jgi:hypothetical protein